jgi:hypothetical protein
MTKNWIQRAIKRHGRIHKYVMKVYGKRAFTRDGKIKMTYINRAIERVKKEKLPKEEKRSLLSALYLAKRLKRIHKR